MGAPLRLFSQTDGGKSGLFGDLRQTRILVTLKLPLNSFLNVEKFSNWFSRFLCSVCVFSVARHRRPLSSLLVIVALAIASSGKCAFSGLSGSSVLLVLVKIANVFWIFVGLRQIDKTGDCVQVPGKFKV